MSNPTPTAALKLLPCPFCGAEAMIDHHEPHSHSEALQRLIPGIPDHPGSYTIECCGKGCNTGQIADTEAEIVAMWNTRATEPALDTERERFEAWHGNPNRKSTIGYQMTKDGVWLAMRQAAMDAWQARAALDKAGDGEPVAYADPQAFLNFKANAESGKTGACYGREWMWAKPDAGLVPLYRHPAPQASADDARVARLLAAAHVYAFNYLQDEADDAENCTCGDKQHAEAKELFAAIAALQRKEG